MKNYFFILTVCLVFTACKNKADQPATDEDSLPAAENYLWQSTLNDSSGKIEMIKVPSNDSLSAQSVIDFLNKDNTHIHLDLVKISADTIFLKIPDAMYLTQQMGSTGPDLYLSEAVYNLTEIPGIHYANFNFEEGDHASPGTYTRDTFKNE